MPKRFYLLVCASLLFVAVLFADPIHRRNAWNISFLQSDTSTTLDAGGNKMPAFAVPQISSGLPPIKVVLTGSTGLVGEGVLRDTLDNPNVKEVLSVSRRPSGIEHPKLKEHLVKDFLTIKADDAVFKGYDSTFFCAGISSVGITEEDYKVITYDTAMHFGKVMLAQNPTGHVFNFVSGQLTDSTETSSTFWKRIKGKTENDLAKLGFKDAYFYRPGAMTAVKGQVNKGPWYFRPLISIVACVAPSQTLSLHEIAHAMVNAAQKGHSVKVLEVPDIRELSRK